MNSASPVEDGSNSSGQSTSRKTAWNSKLTSGRTLLCAMALWVLYDIHSTASGRHIVLQRYREISIGDDIDRVRNIIAKDGWWALEEVALDYDLIRYQSPLTFGARNWTLLVLLEQGGVTGLGVRCADGDHIHPKDAPPDRIADGHESAWYATAGPYGEN